MDIKIEIYGKKSMTGFCDMYGDLIYIGDRVEFTDHRGAVWSGVVSFASKKSILKTGGIKWI